MNFTTWCETFDGRRDCYGTESGGCVHCSEDEWLAAMLRHYEGVERIGVYPLRADGTCRWACVDIDVGREEGWPLARKLALAVIECGGSASVEMSRSKGWHVWVFFDGWVRAAVVRPVMRALCELVDAPTREINPKQDTLSEGGVGNYVRLPLLDGGPERRFYNRDGALLSSWAPRFNTAEWLDDLHKRLVPPPTKRQHSHSTRTSVATCPPFEAAVMRLVTSGPIADRSSALAWLARVGATHGVDYATAMDGLRRVDAVLGKYAGRRDADRYYMKLLERWYGAEAE